MRAASPRLRTSARIAATAASTSAAASRLLSSSSAKAASKPRSALSSLSGIGRLAKPLDPAGQLLRARLQRRPVHDEARGHPGGGLDLHHVFGLQGRAGGDQVGDAPAQAQARTPPPGPVPHAKSYERRGGKGGQ